MSAYSDQVIADGAIAYWRLNETSGTTAVDSIGGFNGTISGGVTLGQPGALVDGDKAMTFDGSTGRINCGTSSTLGFTTAFSAEFWIAFTDLGGGLHAVLGKLDDSLANGWAFFRHASGVMQFFASNAGATNWNFTHPTPIMNDGLWHHVVGWWNGTTAKIFIDGIERQQVATTGAPSIASTPFNIGCLGTGTG